ncbi:FGGY family carbohydrate kinase, partial [Gammaproteobacteria bacterium]|nr:FGGY family carbohydrate kinase [Gammaproteobacteria bacterium]
MSYLGIDLGTSGLRALLVSEDGKIIGAAAKSLTTTHPHHGWSEQDPQQWIDALHAAVAELQQQHPAFADLRGIAVSGHMHGATLLDVNAQVIQPCILWNDTRSAEEAAELDALAGVRETSANIVFPGFTAPKLLWLQGHRPEVFARVKQVLLPAAYLNFYLSGEYVSDRSDCAGTAWLDVASGQWSQRLLSASGMVEAQMPRLASGTEAVGQLRAALAQQWGLSAPVVIAGGAGDNAAAACGVGAINDGQSLLSLGTSGVVLVARDHCDPAPERAVHTFCHAIPDRWYQMGVMLSATD